MQMMADQSSLLVVDVQERLAPVMHDPRKVIYGCATLLVAAVRLGLPMIVSEQYVKGLGPTMVDLREVAPADVFMEKTMFSCAADAAMMERLRSFGRRQVVMAGIEAHVCVLQTALGLKQAGFEVFVVADACSARRPESEDLAFRRMVGSGVSVVNIEMVLFEWLAGKDHPAFKDVQRLIK
ncbi:MAG: hydrolase [Alphaproteobacteria bacterium]